MVSQGKRMKYVFENVASTSEEDSCEDTDYSPNRKNDFDKTHGSGRKPKCFSKNALMARENRLKKKLYITNLERDVSALKTENKKLYKVVENQSALIAELKKETKYLKSVIANSTDISKLIRNINRSTGMSVSSSLDRDLSLKNVCIPKPNVPIARKTAHPWEETERYPSYPTPDSNCFSSPDHNDLPSDLLNDISLDFPESLLDGVTFNEEQCPEPIVASEHDYSLSKQDDDVGVCLHVSKHRVSLEFCTTCSDGASQSWLK